MISHLRLLPLFVVTACSGFDGGLEPVTRLPLGADAEVGDAPDGDVIAQPTLGFVRPAAGASVDGDWVAVELTLEGAALGDGTSIALSVVQAGAVVRTFPFDATTGAVTTPPGAVTLRAELLAGGAPLSPPIIAEVSVSATRTTPAIAFVSPLAGARYELGAPVPYELALTDFSLLAAGAAPTGARQGRLAVSVDGGAPTVTGDKTGALPGLTAGEHSLTAEVLDALGAPWEPPVSATVAFAVDEPPVVSIVAPADGADVDGSRLMVTIATQRFVTDGTAEPGHGTWRARLDGTQVATRLTGTTLSLSGLSAGPHTLEVELRTADDLALTTPATATADFTTVLAPPTIEIVLPTGQRVAEGKVTVAVLPRFFSFTTGAIPGPLVPATGGWELLVDGDVVAGPFNRAETTVVLTPGARTLTARLVDNGGDELSPKVEASRTIDVAQVATSVQILSPAEGETVPKRFPVAVSFEDFTLTQNVLAPNDPPVPGQGHFHAFLRRQGAADFVYQGFFLTETFELLADSPGTWEVLIALHYENHSPVLPAVEDVVTVNVDDRPTIHIASPQDGAVTGRDPMAVSVAIDNFELVPIGEISNSKGHYHLFIDGVYQDFYLSPVALIDPAKTLPAPLTPGPHTLEAFLHRSNHTPVPGAVGHTIDFVYDPTPRLALVAPADGAQVTTAPFEVAAAVDNFTLGVDGGEGLIHVFVDDEEVQTEADARFTLQISDGGEHTVRLELHDNQHTPIAGVAPVSFAVVVDDTPRVAIIAPEDMGFAYGGDLEVMLAPENMPVGGEAELWLDDVLVYAGPVDAPLDAVELPRPVDGPHTIFTVPLTPGGGLPIEGAAIITHRFEVIALEPPTVAFVSPIANATLSPGATVTIGTTGFTLTGEAAREPAVPGDGLWTLSVGARTWGPFSSPSVTLPALPRGPARLVAELWHRDGSRVTPRAKAEVPVQIAGGGPRLSLASPAPGTMVYGDDVALAFDVADLQLGIGTGWISVSVDGRQAGYLPRARGVVGPFAPGLHVLEAELFDGDRQPFSPRVVTEATFRVGGPLVPTLRITGPADGSAVEGGTVDVAFAVTGVTLDPLGLRGRPQAGRGAVLVLVDRRVHALVTESPARLTGLTPGPHEIALQLVGLDLAPIAPTVSDAITVR